MAHAYSELRQILCPHIFKGNPSAMDASAETLLSNGTKIEGIGMVKKKLELQISCPYDAYYARRAALEKPDKFAILKRNALAKADKIVAEIFQATKNIKDLTYIVYSNHGEVLDHFRYNQSYTSSIVHSMKMIEGTSRGNYPYEVVYGNMQMWVIPNQAPKVMKGIGRSIDFTPFALELAQIKPNGMDGDSMLSNFSEGAFPDRDRYAETQVKLNNRYNSNLTQMRCQGKLYRRKNEKNIITDC